MTAKQFNSFTEDAKDHTYSAIFGAAGGGTASAIITTLPVLGYEAAIAIDSSTPLAGLAMGALGLTTAVATIGGGALAWIGPIQFGDGIADKINVDFKVDTAFCSSIIGFVAGAFMSVSLATGSDDPQNQPVAQTQTSVIQLEQAQPEL